MSATLLWTLLGLLLLGVIAWVIVRIAATALGPYSTRLLALGAALMGYYGGLSLSQHAPILFHPVRLRALQYAVPIAGVLALLYCGWRIVQNWRSELQGLLGCLYKLVLVLLLAALARFCFSI
jgi:hypothetical protein